MSSNLDDKNYLRILAKKVGKFAVVSLWNKEGKINLANDLVKKDMNKLSCVDFVRKYNLHGEDIYFTNILKCYGNETFEKLISSNTTTWNKLKKEIAIINKNRSTKNVFISNHQLELSEQGLSKWIKEIHLEEASSIKEYSGKSKNVEEGKTNNIDNILCDEALTQELKNLNSMVEYELVIGEEIVSYNDIDFSALIYYVEHEEVHKVRSEILTKIGDITEYSKLRKILEFINNASI